MFKKNLQEPSRRSDHSEEINQHIAKNRVPPELIHPSVRNL